MEENKPKTGKYALKYGLILGVIGIIFNLLLYSQDLHYQVDLKRLLINVLILLIFIVVGSIFSMKEFKKANEGWMSFGQGMKIGVGMALIFGVINLIFSFVLAEIIDPEMEQKAIEYVTEVMRDAGMTPEQIDAQIESQKNPNKGLQIGGYLIFSIILGFIGSLVPALVLKQDENIN